MKSLITILVSVLYIQTVLSSFDLAVEFRNTNVNVLALYPCQDVSTYYEIELKNNGAKKWAHVFFKLDEDFDGEYAMKLVSDQWSNGAWQENIYSIEGEFCDMLDKYAKKFFTSFRQSITPNLPEDCNFKAGEYTLDDFTSTPSDFSVPSMLFGTFRVHVEIMDPAGENIACFVCEMEASPG